MRGMLFNQKELKKGRQIVSQKNVRSIDFSKGTYQAEVVDQEAVFWPFLQLNKQGEIEDSFCSCSEEKHCAHLAAAFLAIFKEKRNPLHLRFENSFWNKLCQAASKEHGHRADTLVKKSAGWEARSFSDQLFFAIRFVTKEGEEKLQEIIENRPLQTEESSLKFSGLSEEELQLWRQGRPSSSLQYELSFWSDLAKWFLFLQESGQTYQIRYFPKDSLPEWVHVSFKSVECKFFIKPKAWQNVIVSLETVKSSLRAYLPKESSLKTVQYDALRSCFLLEWAKEEKKVPLSEEGQDLGEWFFVSGKGFYSKKAELTEKPNVVEKENVEAFLNDNVSFLRKYLQEKIAEDMILPQYRIEVDSNHNLHIEMFALQPGDLQQPGSALFGRWAYTPQLGFLYLQSPVFSQVKTTILFDQVSDFIKRYKGWLSGIVGFQPHWVPIEPRVLYEVTKEDSLAFSSHVEFCEEETESVDFGDWIFIRAKGFFPKKKEGIIPLIRSGFTLKRKDVAPFLRAHQEELAWIPSFFRSECPVKEVTLAVYLKEDSIHIDPKFSVMPSKEKPIFFEEYVYIKGEGFSLIDRIPPVLFEYLGGRVIRKKHESQFFSQLKILQPWISELDPRLQVPQEMLLNLEKLNLDSGYLHMDLGYKTDLGFVDIQTVWQAVLAGQKYLFSPAGRLDLSQDRFQMLKFIGKDHWKQGEGKLSLTALEWIRLQTQEKIALPADEEVRKALTAFQSCQGFLPLNISRLKSQLRGYQETGLKWLWFLYCYRLSGILCDEMGLGKTHQAMALLAAAAQHPAGSRKFLVVCPTSVIYHWQELLAKFLPDFTVYVFYGQSRQASKLMDSYDILLTSYGILRSEKKELEKVVFDIAIYDEIQQAKNARSQLHRALKSMQVSVRIGLTGTPIENRILELKSLFDLVLPHYLPSEAHFHEQFVLPIEKEQDVERRQLLSKIIHPFVLRRKKVEVLLELPEKVEEISYCDLLPQQRNLYQELVHMHSSKCRKDLEKGDQPSARMHIFALFSKLKQVCDHPCLILGDEDNYLHYESGKWNLFVELLEEARESGQKVVVFTQYLRMMDIIKAYLTSQKIGYAEIRGSTRDRGGALKKFREDDRCEVFVASLQAAGVGIELTSASVVIHYDRWWNPAKEDQATDRVHRIGQNRGVQVFKLVTKHTIEERIHQLICQKKSLLNEVIGFDDQLVIKQFTQQDIIELLASIEQDCKLRDC